MTTRENSLYIHVYTCTAQYKNLYQVGTGTYTCTCTCTSGQCPEVRRFMCIQFQRCCGRGVAWYPGLPSQLFFAAVEKRPGYEARRGAETRTGPGRTLRARRHSARCFLRKESLAGASLRERWVRWRKGLASTTLITEVPLSAGDWVRWSRNLGVR